MLTVILQNIFYSPAGSHIFPSPDAYQIHSISMDFAEFPLPIICIPMHDSNLDHTKSMSLGNVTNSQWKTPKRCIMHRIVSPLHMITKLTTTLGICWSQQTTATTAEMYLQHVNHSIKSRPSDWFCCQIS